MHLLSIVASLGLPDCFIAAGFVRNKVWDHLHDIDSTPLNDVDVIYFDDKGETNEARIQAVLQGLCKDMHWEVKNQARMHLKHHDQPYKNTADAMAHWPEKETAVAVRLLPDSEIDVCAPFGLQSLFDGNITHNPERPMAVFEQRVSDKRWLDIWPELRVVKG